MINVHLLLSGRVQGVGFRPLVFKIAQENGLSGVTYNSSQGLHIHWACQSLHEAEVFKQTLMSNAPAEAKIRKVVWLAPSTESFSGFSILPTAKVHSPESLTLDLTPDFAWCKDCQAEYKDPKNRRYQYPFITCSICGPRYSILTEPAWERSLTAMSHFPMCVACEAEYHDHHNRRFFAESISCPGCSISMTLHGQGQKLIRKDLILEQVQKALQMGQTVAVKGIGGFLLLCSALDVEAVQTLRNRKYRPHKPFAVLMPDVETAEKYVDLSFQAKEWLHSEVSPIVLCPLKQEQLTQVHWQTVSGGLNDLGIMIPYAPLIQWICDLFPFPLVATSANASGESLISDFQVNSRLYEWADWILDHNRTIVNALDDSVLTLDNRGTPVILRRARGLAPEVNISTDSCEKIILGMGAQLKSSYCLSLHGQFFLSPYLGDTTGFDAFERYSNHLKSTLNLIKASPEIIVTDMHPDYPVNELGNSMAKARNLPLFRVQHHVAHVAALIAEHKVDQFEGSTLFLAWDGTGYGTEGNLWGSEFFLYNKGELKHLCSFKPLKHFSNDKFSKEPALAATSASLGLSIPALMQWVPYSTQELEVYQKLHAQSKLLNRSCGRYFDVLSSALGLVQKQSFEGQAAMKLQASAAMGSKVSTGKVKFVGAKEIELGPVLEEVLWISGHQGVPTAALYWHRWLASLVATVANYYQVEAVGMTGGVFQNTLLCQCMRDELENFFHIFTHQSIPANDENISLGQVFAIEYFKNSDYVLSNTR